MCYNLHMSLETWTSEQKAAIEDNSHNLLVSAAAGSGKTAVLVEHIKKLVIEKHVNIDEMLVVTFTEAAASEMKAKIYKALKDSGLSNQIDRMGRSSISSFDSFAYSVVKRYYHIIGLDPSFSICDATKSALLKEEALDDLYEEMFDAKDREFLDFIDCYEERPGDKTIRDMISSLHNFLMSMPDPWAWLDNAVNFGDKNVDKYLSFAKTEILSLLKDARQYYQNVVDMLINANCLKESEKAKADVAYVDTHISEIELDTIKGFESLLNDKHRAVTIRNQSAEYLAIAESVKGIRTNVNACLKDAKALAEGLNKETLLKECEKLAPVLKIYAKLVKRFDEIYKLKKNLEKNMDFADIEHYALAILQNDLVSSEYREKFKYVFIDEYQDTNSVQEALIKKVVSEHNLFMVGDVKQCIYKFRLSEPELFVSHYNDYKSNKDPNNRVIDLNKNFRSKESIINVVNEVFSKIMNEKSCGIIYDDAAKLVKGTKYSGPISYDPAMFILNSQDENEIDNAISEFRKNEFAAAHAVSIIQKYYNKEIYDDKKEIKRPLEYKDMVVLLPAVRNVGEIYYKAFLDANIPVYLDRGEGYFDTLEIEVFLNLLRIINNRKQDIPLLSVLTYPVFGFSSEDLARVRIAFPEGSFSEAFFKYAETNEKAASFVEKLNLFSTESKILPLADFIFKLLLSTGYADFELAKNGGEQRLANLKALVDKAEKFEENNLSGLAGFIDFVEMLSRNKAKIDIGQAKTINESMNCVRIMTVHKSKGLEFPFVLVSGIAENLSGHGEKRNYIFHKDYGIALKLVNPKMRASTDTNIAKLIRLVKKKENLAERIRLLYVAMTRAQDILCFSAYTNAEEDKLNSKRNLVSGDLVNSKTYFDLLYPYIDSANVHIDNKNSLAALVAKNASSSSEFEKVLNCGWNEFHDPKVEEIMSYEYFDAPSNIKKKYSVSQIAEAARTGIEKLQFSCDDENLINVNDVPQFIEQSEHKLSGAERGTAYHTVMEHIPFTIEDKDIDSIKNFINGLADRNILSKAQADCVNPKKISAFFKSEIGKRAVSAKEIYKEAPFVMKHIYNGIEVLVQGTIDCYFEEDGEFVLVDYKSNYVDNDDKESSFEHLKEVYLPQLELYKEALEKITGKTVKQGVLYLFASGDALEIKA